MTDARVGFTDCTFCDGSGYLDCACGYRETNCPNCVRGRVLTFDTPLPAVDDCEDCCD